MIKKDAPIKFKNPNSNMFKVYQAVLHGYSSHQTIVVHTHLNHGSVRAALWNLSFTGMIKCIKKNGRSRYVINDGTETQQTVKSIWANIPSPFAMGESHAG